MPDYKVTEPTVKAKWESYNKEIPVPPEVISRLKYGIQWGNPQNPVSGFCETIDITIDNSLRLGFFLLVADEKFIHRRILFNEFFVSQCTIWPIVPVKKVN